MILVNEPYGISISTEEHLAVGVRSLVPVFQRISHHEIDALVTHRLVQESNVLL